MLLGEKQAQVHVRSHTTHQPSPGVGQREVQKVKYWWKLEGNGDNLFGHLKTPY